MKKIIELSVEVEQHLAAIFDHALKFGGYQIKRAIDIIEKSIQQVESNEQK